MSKITTDDCKKYLVDTFKDKGTNTLEKDWKRTKKYKNEDGFWVRDFTHGSIGNVSLLENEVGILSLVDSQNQTQINIKQASPNTKSTKSFDLLVFSDQQKKDAWKAYEEYYDDDTDQNDEFLAKNDVSIRCIPGILNWYVPSDAYENYDLKPKKMSWNFNMKGFNFVTFDQKNYHEYGGDEYLMEKYLPPYVSKCDEYHYEIEDDITVEQLVRDLSALGYAHADKYFGEKSVISNLMKTATFNEIPFVVSQLELDILSGNIKNYSINNLNSQKVNNQSVAFFSFVNNKLDVFNYLVDNKIGISNQDFSSLIEKNHWGFKDNPTKLDSLLRVALEYDSININNDIIHKLVFSLNELNKKDELIALFNKYSNSSNALTFASSELLLEEPSVITNLVQRFTQHDDELTVWIEATFISEENTSLLKNKEIRNALTKNYISSILDKMHNEYLESLKYEMDRERGGMMIVEVRHDGTQESWGQQSARNLARFTVAKNKIMSYFNKNDDDDTPKPKYRTKF